MADRKQVINPYLPNWEYVPDGEPHVFGDRVYVYGSHDFFGGDVYCMGDYVCWSAPVDNLGDWKYEGVIYRKDQDPHNTDLQGNLAPGAWSPSPSAMCRRGRTRSMVMSRIRTEPAWAKRPGMSPSLTPVS